MRSLGYQLLFTPPKYAEMSLPLKDDGWVLESLRGKAAPDPGAKQRAETNT